MKKLMSVMLGLTFVLGTATMFAQDTKDTTAPHKEKKAKKAKKEKKTTEEKK